MTDPISPEAPTRALAGVAGRLASALAIALSLYGLYWVLFIVQPQVYRVSFLLIAIVLIFLYFPLHSRGRRGPVGVLDWLLIAAAVAALGWPIADFGRFVHRVARPWPIDLALGTLAIVLILE